MIAPGLGTSLHVTPSHHWPKGRNHPNQGLVSVDPGNSSFSRIQLDDWWTFSMVQGAARFSVLPVLETFVDENIPVTYLNIHIWQELAAAFPHKG